MVFVLLKYFNYITEDLLSLYGPHNLSMFLVSFKLYIVAFTYDPLKNDCLRFFLFYSLFVSSILGCNVIDNINFQHPHTWCIFSPALFLKLRISPFNFAIFPNGKESDQEHLREIIPSCD